MGGIPSVANTDPNTQCLAAHLPVCGANSNRETDCPVLSPAVRGANSNRETDCPVSLAVSPVSPAPWMCKWRCRKIAVSRTAHWPSASPPCYCAATDPPIPECVPPRSWRRSARAADKDVTPGKVASYPAPPLSRKSGRWPQGRASKSKASAIPRNCLLLNALAISDVF